MAILIIEHGGGVEGANLTGRVLIGRRTSNHIVIPEPTVSRIHAWIDTANGQYCVTDTGSRTGTYVNEKLATGKRPLADGDQIRIGSARLTFRTAPLPDGVIRREFANKSPADLETQGILFDCACGAPLWVTLAYAGKTGRCRHCGRVVRVPSARARAAQTAGVVPAGAGATPAAPGRPAGVGTTMCGICQSAISVFEDVTDCPSCGLRFHADCWQENYGCSAYGCDQVNVLKPPAAAEAGPGPPPPAPTRTPAAARAHAASHAGNGSPGGRTKVPAATAARPKAPAGEARVPAAPPSRGGGRAPAVAARGTVMTYRAMDQAAANAATVDEVVMPGGRFGGGEGTSTWDYACLGASVLAALAGALAWGVPSLLVSIGVLAYLNRHRGERKPTVILIAAAVALLGTIAGVVLSFLFWFGLD